MKLSCLLFLLYINCARTNLDNYNNGFEVLPINLVGRIVSTYDNHRLNKRDSPPPDVFSEGGKSSQNAAEKPQAPNVPATANKTAGETQPVSNDKPIDKPVNIPEPTKEKPPSSKETATATSTVKPQKTNVPPTQDKPKSQLDFGDPGVIERALIVFGGFAMLGLAYFIFYRKSSGKNDTINPTDNNQFRYGVLNSEDQRESMELSRVPLTMDSDDDDEEDLEIFDLTQKTKSLSYVNLQTSELKSDMDTITNNENETLLLDIDDRTDTLINWSNENKT